MGTRVAALLIVLPAALAGCGTSGGSRVFVTSGCVAPVHDPPAIVMSCDGSSVVRKIHWRGWDGPVARGAGLELLVTCVPDCASGSHRLVPVTLLASDPKRCPTGRLQYRSFVVYRSGPAIAENAAGVAGCAPR